MKVLIDNYNVTNYGKQIEDYANELDDEIKKFSTLIESINEVWNGSDALKYINIMKERYIVGLDELKSLLNEYGDYLTKVPDTYASLDEVFMTKHIDV